MKTSPPTVPAPARPWRWLGGAAAAAVLALTFAAYLDPHTVVDLANRLWSCF
ncbi:MAG TPA: hypothetical protein VLA16_10270 [Ideonella sp.]|nr:hypothetical protein [Ideonella sp.]